MLLYFQQINVLLIKIRFLPAGRTASIVPIAWRWECKTLFTWVPVFNCTIQLPRTKFRNKSMRYIWTMGEYCYHMDYLFKVHPTPTPLRPRYSINGDDGNGCYMDIIDVMDVRYEKYYICIWAILYIYILYDILTVTQYGSWRSTSCHLYKLFVKSRLTRSTRLIVFVPVNRRIMLNT